MRIDLECPYREKDRVKALGARWDVDKKVWYIVDVEDLTPFMRWIPRKKEVEVSSVCVNDRVCLSDFIEWYYGGAVSLTFKSAKAFGVPYPLESGWAKKYARNTALLSDLSVGKRSKRKINLVPKAKPVKTSGTFNPLCDCSVLPWEDCEHTEELAMNAMKEMI